jgi:hypothetical protein
VSPEFAPSHSLLASLASFAVLTALPELIPARLTKAKPCPGFSQARSVLCGRRLACGRNQDRGVSRPDGPSLGGQRPGPPEDSPERGLGWLAGRILLVFGDCLKEVDHVRGSRCFW